MSVIASAIVAGTDVTVTLSKRTQDDVNTWISDERPLFIVTAESPSGFVNSITITEEDEEKAREYGRGVWSIVRDKRDLDAESTKPVETPKPKPGSYTITEGFWMVKCGSETTIYKVQRSQETGYLYGKRFDPDGFVYARGALRDLRECGEPLDEETATQFGKLYGTCVMCGRTLTNEESIARGIGPICASRQGW